MNGRRISALQPLHERKPVVQRLKFFRVGVQTRHGIVHRPRQLLHAQRYFLKFLAPCRGRFVVLRHLRQPSVGGNQRGGRGNVVLACQRRRDSVRAIHDLGRMRGGGMPCGKFRLVLFGKMRGVDVVDRIAKTLALFGDVGNVALERVQPRTQIRKLVPRLGIFCRIHFAVRIEKPPLERFVQERLVVVGSMHVHKQASCRAQRLHRRSGVVHPYAAAAGRRNDAPDEQHSVLGRRKPVLFQQGGYGTFRFAGERKLGFDAGVLCAVAHGRSVGPRAKHELKRAHQHALARAGLAGDDV